VVKNDLKIFISIRKSKSVTHSVSDKKFFFFFVSLKLSMNDSLTFFLHNIKGLKSILSCFDNLQIKKGKNGCN